MSPILFLLPFQPLECGRGDQDQVTKMLYCSLRTHLPCSEKAQATHTQLCIVVPMTAQLRQPAGGKHQPLHMWVRNSSRWLQPSHHWSTAPSKNCLAQLSQPPAVLWKIIQGLLLFWTTRVCFRWNNFTFKAIIMYSVKNCHLAWQPSII